MLAQIADLRLCALMFLSPNVPATLCLRPYVLSPYVFHPSVLRPYVVDRFQQSLKKHV